MGKTKGMFGDKPKAARLPKPFSVRLRGVAFTGVRFSSGTEVAVRIAATFRKGGKDLSAAMRIRPQQYAVRIAAYAEAGSHWEGDKLVKTKTTGEREIYSADAKVSGLSMSRSYDGTKLSFTMSLPAEFAERSADIKNEEVLAVTLSSPQLSLC